jgi:hypothetical protein
MKYHVNMKIDTAIREIKKGVDLFQMPKEEALKGLQELKQEGKQYVTGCEEQDSLGKCKGHSDEPTKTVDLLKDGTLLSPSPDKCQECAVAHDPEQAHDANSLHYQYKFKKDHGRWPTWKDAIEHCPETIKDFWITQLKEHGIDATL